MHCIRCFVPSISSPKSYSYILQDNCGFFQLFFMELILFPRSFFPPASQPNDHQTDATQYQPGQKADKINIGIYFALPVRKISSHDGQLSQVIKGTTVRVPTKSTDAGRTGNTPKLLPPAMTTISIMATGSSTAEIRSISISSSGKTGSSLRINFAVGNH